ncbi:MAG TPA: HAMP domain-containing sensor histidine kinase [Nitrospirota bacterium]|nr:HAMP domain-containing sensor histidine kinase [Nitrospirota bacterium]
MKEISFSADKKLCICAWEKEVAEFTGQSSTHIIGKKYYEIFPRIFTDNKDALSESIKNGKTLSLKGYSFNCLFGRITADIRIKPIKSLNHKVDSVKVIIAPHSTCAVAKKLHQSQRLIDIGKIASTLAHGVRNPLNAIKGAVVYLREKYDYEEPLVEFTKIMEEEISRLENFISRFLSSSVSETEVRETDINSLLKKIEILTSLQIYTRNVQSLYELGSIPPITINSFHLEQAILNVINNALDAMNAGGQLKIRTFTEERSGRIFVVISISDTGTGISDRRIADISSENGENGRGFGLFITYEILKHYGGHLEIDSKKNMGTTIKLFIPSQHTA